jgi:hypothetical protein
VAETPCLKNLLSRDGARLLSLLWEQLHIHGAAAHPSCSQSKLNRFPLTVRFLSPSAGVRPVMASHCKTCLVCRRGLNEKTKEPVCTLGMGLVGLVPMDRAIRAAPRPQRTGTVTKTAEARTSSRRSLFRRNQCPSTLHARIKGNHGRIQPNGDYRGRGRDMFAACFRVR